MDSMQKLFDRKGCKIISLDVINNRDIQYTEFNLSCNKKEIDGKVETLKYPIETKWTNFKLNPRPEECFFTSGNFLTNSSTIPSMLLCESKYTIGNLKT
jgi:hypothetical protein